MFLTCSYLLQLFFINICICCFISFIYIVFLNLVAWWAPLNALLKYGGEREGETIGQLFLHVCTS